MKKILALEILDDLIVDDVSSGRIIRSRRKNLGLTQEDVSKMTGLQTTFISAIENDKKSLGVQSAIKIAAAIGLHPGTILFSSNFKDSNEIKKIEKMREKILKSKVA